MDNQVIISISREHGSLGHEIAIRLAEKLGIELYDKDILSKLTEKVNMDADTIVKYDEKPRNVFISRVVNGYSNSLEEVLAEKVFEYERELADSGKSFIIVGRCADYVLRDNPNLISIFITGNEDVKLKHIMESRHKNRRDAKAEIRVTDRHRESYHNNHAKSNWRDFSTYNLIINSSVLGLDGTVDAIRSYVDVWKSEKGKSAE